jgi:hypothetical protein
MEAILSSETSPHTKSTRSHTQEEGILLFGYSFYCDASRLVFLL